MSAEPVGARDHRRDGRCSRAQIVLLPVIVAISFLPTACDGNGGSGPSRLLDGSHAAPPPVALEGIAGPAVLSSVRSVPGGRLEQGSAAAACLEQQRGNARVLGPLVARVGVSGASVTFRDRSGRGVYGCDATSVDRD